MFEIFKTRDYSIFKKTPFNRDIDPGNLKKITESMKQKNLLEANPIKVNSSMEIIDGQHRLLAAKNLNLEVSFICLPDAEPEDIIRLSANQKNWNIEDCVNFYRASNIPSYVKLVNFCEKNQIRVRDVISITSTGGDTRKGIKKGEMRSLKEETFENLEFLIKKIRAICETLSQLSVKKNPVANSLSFKRALFTFLQKQGVYYDVFIKKIQLRPEKIRGCTTVDAYHELFKEIYNYKNQFPMP